MYAVIRVGTSQERVTEGQVVRVDLRKEEVGADVEFQPVLLVDGDEVTAGPALKGATVTGKILGEEKGPKIRGLTYKPEGHPAPPLGTPSALFDRRDHQDLGQGLRSIDVKDQRWRFYPQRP